MAAALASFNMSMDSISDGLSDNNGFIGAPLLDSLVLMRGMPSITYKGSVPALILEAPRICTWTAPSSFPLFWLTLTPAAFPDIVLWKFETAILEMSSEFNLATLPVIDLLLELPYPITRTSFNNAKDSSMVTEISF